VVEGHKVQCYDAGTQYADRYTVVYMGSKHNGKYECYGLSENPFSPNMGVAQHGECTLGSHLGKKISFDDLPEQVQKAVRYDLAGVSMEYRKKRR
jgi:hypothetical protein